MIQPDRPQARSAISDFTEDGFLGGRLILRQPRTGHRAGHDAILLAASAAAEPGARVADLGAGIGAAGLALAARVRGLDLALVEIDPALVAMAQHNAARNGLSARAVTLDVAAGAESFAAAGLGPDSFDVVLMNPPFNNAARHRASPDAARMTAHHAQAGTLDVWVHAARRLLKSGGTLSLIWRAEDVNSVLSALSRGFGGVAVMPVHPRAGTPAIRVLVGAVKGTKAPLKLLAGLNLDEADAMLRGERGLALL